MKEIETIQRKRQLRSLSVNKDVLDPILAFVISMLGFLFLAFAWHMEPFGDSTVLASDLDAQYSPFIWSWLNHLRDVLEGEHFINNFSYMDNLGAGKNVFGILGYYTASPFVYIVGLFGLENVYLAIWFLIVLKNSIAAALMTIFIRSKMTNKESHIAIVLGLLYAFNSYSILFSFNIMWIDAYALLPLTLLFADRFIEKENKRIHIGFILTLVVLFVSQFYMAYMVGIFTFLYLVFRIVEEVYCKNNNQVLKKTKTIILNFISHAIISALLSSFFLFPAIYDTLVNRDQTSYAFVNDIVKDTEIDQNPLILFQSFFLGNFGSFNEVLSGGRPFFFTSVLITLSLIVFFFSSAFSKKEKIVYGSLIGFMLLSFTIIRLDIAWHAFDEPNWFYHRYSFCLIPITLIIGLKVYEKLCKRMIEKRIILISGLVMYLILVITDSFVIGAYDDAQVVLNIVFIALYVFYMIGIEKEKWHEQLKNMSKICSFLLVLSVSIEAIFVNNNLSMHASAFTSGTKSFYYEDAFSVVGDCIELGRSHTDAFRSEIEGDRIRGVDNLTAGSYMDYSSISLFNTNSNKPFARFIKNFGHMTAYNYFATQYDYAAMPTDAFFSIGTIITEREYENATLIATGNMYENQDIDEMPIYAYSNPYIFPLGFAVQDSAMAFDFYSLETNYENKNYFTMQNEWYRSMFGNAFSVDIYDTYEDILIGEPTIINGFRFPEQIDFEYAPQEYTREDAFANENIPDGQEYVKKIIASNIELPTVLEYSFEAQYTGEHYINYSVLTVPTPIVIYVDDQEINSLSGYSQFSSVTRLGYYEKGEMINVSIISIDVNLVEYLGIYFACLNEEAFISGYEMIRPNLSNVTMTDYEQGYVTFNTNLSEGEMLLTTIPYEAGWTCYVDGVETEITPYQGALIAVDVGSGSHEVVLEFVAPGLVPGFVVSAATIGVLVVAGFVQIILKSRSKSSQNK